MRWLARLTGLILAAGGVGAAHALVPAGNAMEQPVPTVTAPTVPVPTEPAPTVPASSTPASTTPTPPPVRLAPVVTTPSTRLVPAPPATTEITVTVDAEPQAPARRAAPSPSSMYVAPTPQPEPSSAPAAARPTRAARARTFDATMHRTSGRVSVRLAVMLPASGRAFLIVRGPAPSCRVAGYVPLRGQGGATTVFFAGRVHGRRLDPGVYRISLSPNRRLVTGAPTEFVRVAAPRRSVPLPESAPRPACSRAAPVAKPAAKKPPAPPTARVAEAAAKEPAAEDADDAAAAALPVAGVLGEATEEPDAGPFLAIAVLALVAGLLLAMVGLVTKFLRGSWNP